MKNLKKYLIYFLLSVIVFTPFLVVKTKAEELPSFNDSMVQDLIDYNHYLITKRKESYYVYLFNLGPKTALTNNYTEIYFNEKPDGRYYYWTGTKWSTSSIIDSGHRVIDYQQKELYSSFEQSFELTSGTYTIKKKYAINVTELALAKMETNLGAAFGNLSLVGGVILGLLLVGRLVIRSLRLAKL